MLAICIICTTTFLHPYVSIRILTHPYTPIHQQTIMTSIWAIPAGRCCLGGGRVVGRRICKDTKNVGWTRNKDVLAPLLACDIFYECKSLFIRIWFTYLRAASSVFLAPPAAPPPLYHFLFPPTHTLTLTAVCTCGMCGWSFSSVSVFFFIFIHIAFSFMRFPSERDGPGSQMISARIPCRGKLISLIRTLTWTFIFWEGDVGLK